MGKAHERLTAGSACTAVEGGEGPLEYTDRKAAMGWTTINSQGYAASIPLCSFSQAVRFTAAVNTWVDLREVMVKGRCYPVHSEGGVGLI